MYDFKILKEFISQLSYFDLLAFLEQCALHPGGIQATAEVFNNAGLAPDARVLEIGCGTGHTTLNLLKAGFNLTSCDVNSHMVEAAAATAHRNGFPSFSPVCADAADLPFADNSFDLILIEAVLGFIDKPVQAVSEFRRVLKEGGYVAFVDMFYFQPPPESVLQDLKKIFGKNINVFTRDSYRQLFGHFNQHYWNEYEMTRHGTLQTKGVSSILLAKGIVENESDAMELALVIEERFLNYQAVFIENRKYLKYSVAIWKKMPEPSVTPEP